MGTQKNPSPNETVLLSTHNTCLRWWKIIAIFMLNFFRLTCPWPLLLATAIKTKISSWLILFLNNFYTFLTLSSTDNIPCFWCLSKCIKFPKKMIKKCVYLPKTYSFSIWPEECGGSVVECLTRDWGVSGSGLTRDTALCPWARHFIICLLLVQLGKINSDIGSVVECLTRDREAASSSLTGVTALWSFSKTHLS